MNRKSIGFFWLFFVLLTFSCFAAPTDKKQESEKTLTFGAVAYASPKSGSEKAHPFQILADYLSRKLNVQINLKFYSDYPSILTDIDHEILDIALLSPVVYAMCMDNAEIDYLGTLLFKGKHFYHAVLLAGKDGGILTLKDLKGKKVGFVDRYSASGYIFPAALLRSSGLVENDVPLYTPVFLGSHERVVRALMEKQVDAAATFQCFFDFAGFQVGEKKNVTIDQFRILKILPEKIPEDAVVCRHDLGEKVVESIRNAFLDFETERAKPGSNLVDTPYTGFKTDNRLAYEEVKSFLEGIIGKE